MPRRNPGVRGLSYVQVNHGRVTNWSVNQDVADAKARIERDFPRIRVRWDHETQEHLVTQTDSEGTETLLFATRSFHEDLIRARIGRANNENSDPLDEVDRYNSAVEREQDRQFSEQMADVGQRLAHAFGQDGLTVRPRMGPLSVPMRKSRHLQNFEVPNR